MKFSNTINDLLFKFFAKLIFLFTLLNLPLICALICRLNLRKVKKIYCKRRKKRAIVLPKSGGYDDLLAAYNKKDFSNEVEFFTLPRILIKNIFYYYLSCNPETVAQGGSAQGDYFTLYKDEKLIKKKEKYYLFLKKLFIYLDKIWKFDAVISFNMFYFAENDVHRAVKEIGKKSIIAQKETAYTVVERKYYEELFRENNEKFSGDKISVYTESEKKILINTNLVNENQISVVGCARLDFSFNFQKEIPEKNIILYFMIEPITDAPDGKILYDWSSLSTETSKHLIEYAKENPNVKIIFKGKVGIHERSILPKNLPKNIIFISGGPGHDFIKKAGTVIAFNSSAVMETIAARRNLIVPNFKIDNIKLKDYLPHMQVSKYYVNNYFEFKEKLNKYCKKNFEITQLDDEEKIFLNDSLGNSDGYSGDRLRLFIKNSLYN